MDANTIEFEKILHACGYKLTAQRQAILEIIRDAKNRHLCTEEIFEEVKKSYPGIGLATVYRTLQLFEKLGLVRHILLDDGCMRFQIIHSKEKHQHHHLVCEICGDVIDVEEDMLGTLEEKLLTEKGFTVKDHKVQFYGICKRCAEKESKLKSGGNKMYSIGIDIGYSSVKVMLTDEENAIKFSRYQLHKGQIKNKLKSILKEMLKSFDPQEIKYGAVTGSGSRFLSADGAAKAVNEVV